MTRPPPLHGPFAPRALAAAVLALAALAPGARADEAKQTYQFGTHPARQTVTFVSEAEVETIHGVSHVVVGSVVYDPAAGTAVGRLSVPVKDMHTGIDLRDTHLQSPTWLDAAKYPEVVLELTKATASKTEKGVFDYAGKLTIHGVTKDWAGKASVRFVGAEAAAQAKLGAGDWVRVRTDFDVPIEDFGVKVDPGVAPKVNKVWKVSFDAWGTTAPPPPK